MGLAAVLFPYNFRLELVSDVVAGMDEEDASLDIRVYLSVLGQSVLQIFVPLTSFDR